MISGKSNFYDALSIAKNVKAGYETTLSVQPIEVVGTKSLSQMSESERKCKYPNEAQTENSSFKTYSQASCEFECQINFAREKCLCTPWSIPILPGHQVSTYSLDANRPSSFYS